MKCTRTLVLAIVVAAAAACGSGDDPPSTAVIDPGDGGRYAPVIRPTDFVGRIDNPYFPMLPGARWEYEAATGEGTERIVVEVTDEQRTVMGVPVVVVHDVVTLDGATVEDTFDWYAQDRDGNVWYFGEAVRNFEDGRFSDTDGSFEAGVDGALPGVVMLADPRVGDTYRQEFYEGEAEDLGEVLRLGQRVEVPFGAFDGVLVTRDWNPLEPEVVEEKYYAPGIGVVLERTVTGGSETVELVRFVAGG